MLIEAIERFVEQKIQPVSREADETETIPADLIQAGWDFGLLSSAIPIDYGGFGDYSALTGALAIEALAHGDLAITLNMTTPSLFTLPVMFCGTKLQQGTYLPACCLNKPPRFTAALTEPVVQFDPRCLEVTARRQDGCYYLNGTKSLVPLADEAEQIIVYANEDGVTQAFIVKRSSEGIEFGSREKLMGLKALPTFQLRFNDCQIPVEQKLGNDQGIDFSQILNHCRVAQGAAAVGLANAGYNYARAYAKNRVQFGEPIAHRQSIAFMLAEMAIEIDAARLLVWEAAWKIDNSKDITPEATVLKHFVDRMVMKVADGVVQILGGYGYIREFPAELWLRNARGFASFEGLAIV